MSWEAFLGALLPCIVTTLAALAAYFRSGRAAKTSDESAKSSKEIVVSQEERIKVVNRLEQKLDQIIAALAVAQTQAGKRKEEQPYVE